MPDHDPPTGTLFVVATPLGHLEDLTLRALPRARRGVARGLRGHAPHGTLLRAHGIATATTSYFEHNERWKGERILDALRAGRDVALVSDAGTPGISDPGYRLVRDARAEGLAVVPVPGPSAAIAALSVSGLPTDRFLFVGFLPAKAGCAAQGARGARRGAADARLLRVAACASSRRSRTCSRRSATARPSCAARRPRLHEEYVRAPLSELRERLAARDERQGRDRAGRRRARPRPRRPSEDPVALYRRLAAEGRTRREAVKEAARRLGRPAREVYAIVQAGEPERSSRRRPEARKHRVGAGSSVVRRVDS